MKYLFYTFTVLVVFFPLACKKGDSSTPDMGYDYFPDVVGHFVVYDVDSTNYDDFFIPTKITTYKFQIKEKIASIFLDNQNRSTIRLERFVKKYDSLVPYSSMSWVLQDVWSENVTATTAEKVEENDRYIRLIFPVRDNKEWDANVQNIYDQRDFSYEYVDETKSIGGKSYANVLETLYDDGGGILTSREYRTEKYARGIGMVYRRMIVVESQPEAGASATVLQTFFAKPIMDRVSSGYQYTMTINTYGVD